MTIKALAGEFTVCQVRDFSGVDWTAEYCFAAKTDSECSLVCRTGEVPGNVTRREDGWRALRIEGVLEFSLVGVLAELSALLAARKIGIFVVSTYHTDYILTKAQDFPQALEALAQAGHLIV